MGKFGFIGYGHMGSVLLNSFLAAGALVPGDVLVSTRTPEKLTVLQKVYPNLETTLDNCEVARKSSLLFLCVPTGQVHTVFTEICTCLPADLHLVNMSGGLEIASLEKLYPGPLTKIMPTLQAEVREGVTLVCHNSRVSDEQQARLSHLLEKVGLVKRIREDQFEAVADLTSCAPGLLACICREFARAGAVHGDLEYDEAAELFLRTLHGTARLLFQRNDTFDNLIERVATAGGATEGGVQVLKAQLPGVFDDVFAATLERHERRKQATRQQFGL